MYTTKQKGFTIVELLIVIVVIAILAAISIVAFTGIQQRGRDSERASDVSNIVKALTAYTSDDTANGGSSGVWPADGAEAKTALQNYKAANLSSDITNKITGSGTPGSGNDNYVYTACSGDGAKITYWKESGSGGGTETVTAGSCPTP